jgi:predicted phosphodiesterase
MSDVHANLEALRAVLRDASLRGGFQSVWCLGDLVGYGPDPGACLALLREHELVAVAGNHDHAAIGRIDPGLFNAAAAAAARWTAAQLSPEETAFLGGLPLTVASGPFTLVHGSLRAPVWEYLLDVQYQGISSLVLLARVAELLGAAGWRISNVDATILAQKPLMGPSLPEMQRQIGATLALETDRVSIKVTTTDYLGFVGREEGIAACAIATVVRT